MEKMLRKPVLRAGLAILCCALWGSAFPCVKLGYEWLHIEGAGSQILFAGYRFTLAGIFTFLLASALEKRLITIQKRSVPYVFAQGILQTTIQYVCFYIGMANTTGAKGAVINASNAFFAIIAAHLLMKTERITWEKALGCIVGFAGVIVMNLAPGALGSGVSLLGEGMIVICSCAYGTSSVTMKMISHREGPAELTAYQLLFGGVVLIFIGVAAGGSVQGFTYKSAVLLLYMAMLSAVAFTIWTALLKYNPVGKVTVFGFSIPIFGVALSALFLHESVWSFQNLAALILVSMGILIVNGEGGFRFGKKNFT